MRESKEMLIDKFLRKELNKEEQERFDSCMLEEDFVQLLNEQNEIIAGLKDVDEHNMKQLLQGLEKDIIHGKDTQPSNKIYSLSKWINKIAAILIISMMIVGANYMFNTSLDFEKIVDNYYEPYPNIVDPITKGDNSKSPSVYQLYEMNKFNQVIEDMSSRITLSDQERFYLASSYLANEQLDSASNHFKLINKNDAFGQASQWYLAMICLSVNHDNCKQLFVEILDDNNHIYQSKADQILKEI